MKEDNTPLMFPSTVTNSANEEIKTHNYSSCWDHTKELTFLISAVVLGLFDVLTDWQNFIKYVSRPEELREFILLVAVLYFLFCCFIRTFDSFICGTSGWLTENLRAILTKTLSAGIWNHETTYTKKKCTCH